MSRGWTKRVTWLATLVALAACGGRTQPLACLGTTASGQCSASSGTAGAPIGVAEGGAQNVGGSAGTAPNNGGSGNVVASGAGGSSGSSGFASAGEGGLAGAATVGPHWIALSVSHAAYAYDVTRYPLSGGLFPLSQAPPDMTDSAPAAGPWSPDGKQIVYRDVKDWYVRDMTANPPSAGRLLVASPAPPAAFLPPPQFSWSPDSKTIALVSGQTLSLLDPTRPAIGPALISNTLASFSWAPVGGRLLLKDNSGSSLVSVDGDLTSAPQVLGLGTLTMWSPDGKYLVTSTNGDLTLIDVTGNTAVTTVVTKRMIPTPSVTQVMFSADSSFLVFAGAQVRAQADVFYVSLKPGIGAPALVSNTLAPMMVAADRLLFVSPDGHWIGYSTTSHNQSTFAAEMVGAKVVAQFPLLLSIDARFAWLPERPQFFVAMAINNAQVFNLPATNSTFFPTGGSSSQSLSPVADVLLWSGNPSQVSLQDLDTQAPATTIDAKLESSQLLWSPDGQFISLLDAEAGGDAIELIRVTGAVPSPRVAIGPLGNSDSVSAWPPVFP